MACLWLSGPLIIPLLILSPPVPRLFPTLSRVRKTDSRSHSEPPQHSPLPYASCLLTLPTSIYLVTIEPPYSQQKGSNDEDHMLPCGVDCSAGPDFFFFYCSSFESAYVYAVLNIEENWSWEQLRQIRSSLLHLYSASLAFSTGRPPHHFSFALLSSGMFLLCLHESKAVSGLFLSLLSPGHISFALHTSSLIESLKHCILRKNSYVNAVTFIIGYVL